MNLKREFMQTSKNFSIYFWLIIAKIKDDLAPIYAHITVDSKRAEISLKRFTEKKGQSAPMKTEFLEPFKKLFQTML